MDAWSEVADEREPNCDSSHMRPLEAHTVAHVCPGSPRYDHIGSAGTSSLSTRSPPGRPLLGDSVGVADAGTVGQ